MSVQHGRKGRAFVLALLYVLIPNVGEAFDFSVNAREVTGARWNGQAADVEYSAQAKLPGGNRRYKKIRAQYSANRIVQIAKKSRALNPGAAAFNFAIIGAISAAGWFIDDLTGQVLTGNPGTGSGSGQAGHFYIANPGYTPSSEYLPSPEAALEQWCGMTGHSNCYLVSPTMGKYTHSGNGIEYNLTIGEYSCTNYSQDWLDTYAPNSGCTVAPPEPVTEEELQEALTEAIEELSPAELRQAFETIANNPEMFPELATALQDWTQAIEDETGLDGSEIDEDPTDESEDAQDVLDVRVVEPVQIDETDVPTEREMDELPDDLYKDITNYADNLPDLPSIPRPGIGLDHSSSCETLTLSWRGTSVVFPSTDQCQKLNAMKSIMEWFLSVVTLFGCWYIILGKRGVPNA
ncbi:hypothetical protein [Marinobacterium arenosum]|uniref:hypothetical protein n=1 Tax=Marinobacterium arenosum TaxID=2862496 RepID=UPI001C9572FF|nr:hypothetical protein [Marinobacterium arenosum]MBY4675898.1 hypothetical protein [Marinobacterium arenosum]